MSQWQDHFALVSLPLGGADQAEIKRMCYMNAL